MYRLMLHRCKHKQQRYHRSLILLSVQRLKIPSIWRSKKKSDCWIRIIYRTRMSLGAKNFSVRDDYSISRAKRREVHTDNYLTRFIQQSLLSFSPLVYTLGLTCGNGSDPHQLRGVVHLYPTWCLGVCNTRHREISDSSM